MSGKAKEKNLKNGHKEYPNSLEAVNKIEQKKLARQRREAEKKEAAMRNEIMDVDEGIADMSDSSVNMDYAPRVLDVLPDEESPGSDEDTENDMTPPGNSMTQDQSAMPKAKRRMKNDGEADRYLNANEVRAALVQLFEREAEVLSLVYDSTYDREPQAPSADIFFLRTLIVPPNKWRKEHKSSPDDIREAAVHTTFKRILELCQELIQVQRELQGEQNASLRRLRNFDDLQNIWVSLQESVNGLIDSEKASTRGPAVLKVPGIKQNLEKKEGLFRTNIMGKRVNFAARSVISPDPNIETNEIGIPPVFAKKLTYPEPVTSHSFDELKQAVLNGPETWPGAAAVEYENGQVISLQRKNLEDRQAMANLLLAPSSASMTGVRNKKVHRHLNNGDIVIMNRQPTLHKPSMMAHRARVLQGEKTIRMHYANCNTYNADFDGDEMNMHFPQNELARAEAFQIADTDHQYLSATAGKPLRGLIQDHVSMSVWLTSAGTVLTKEEYQGLLYSCIKPENGDISSNRISTIEPAILKPAPRWTGKQVITTILRNLRPEDHSELHFEGTTATPAELWGKISSEGVVRVHDGQLITGILDKKQIGATAGGLVHMVYEAWGPTVAGKLMTILGRLLTKFLNMRAFSCGVEDLLLTQSGEETRKEKLAGLKHIAAEVAAKYVSLDADKHPENDLELLSRLESITRDEEKLAGLDALTGTRTKNFDNEVEKACLPSKLEKSFPANQMQLMTNTGAKGSAPNAKLISCNLGQQNLEGRRVPVMISGKTLPCFKPFEPTIRAGGYVVDRFLTGVRPQEYFFHLMTGREGLVDTAVKTSRSGYLQRCLIKGMEGLRAEHDASIRDSDGTMIQTVYGEDGLDIIKQKNIMNFQFLGANFKSIGTLLRLDEDAGVVLSPEARKYNKEAEKKARRFDDIAASDPVMARYSPATHAGSNSEIYMRQAKLYADKNEHQHIRQPENGIHRGIKSKNWQKVVDFNYMRSVVEPGEAVGVVAGQSIGEPSTQMTLNTFHMAGHAAKNVTLGIPRLREILMAASRNIKTPTMTLHLIEEMDKQQAEQFASGLSKHSLAEVIDSTRVKESFTSGSDGDTKNYEVHLQLYPSAEYTETYGVAVADVLKTIEDKFLKRLEKLIVADLKRRSKEKSPTTVTGSDALPTIGKSTGRVQEETAADVTANEGGDSDADDAGDEGDATNAKRRANLDESRGYEENDEEDDQIAQAGERESSPSEVDDDEGYGGSPRSSAEPSGDEDDTTTKTLAKDREARLKESIKHLTSFHFDDRHGSSCTFTLQYHASTAKILLLPLVKRAAHQAVLQEITGITSALCTSADPQKPESHPYVLTSGVNLVAMRNYQDMLDPHRLRTNDIWSMRDHYGVEAARNTIIEELRAVFEGHHIDVDVRHLTLIADYMTRDGGIKAFSRLGMDSNTSPFKKMSFETTTQFVNRAVLFGEREDLQSPSARITVGRLGRMGTGAFDVLMPVAGHGAGEEEEVEE